MGGNPHLLKLDRAYETTPNVGPNGLRFPLERYFPTAECIDIDADIKHNTTFKLMGRNSSHSGWCFRCSRQRGQHPKRLCPCQWCGGAADGGHPDRECPWIYATVSTWKDKLVLRDPSTGRIRSDLVPVNVQIKPTREEQDILARMDSRFLDFPNARQGHDVKIPDGVFMRKPWRQPRPLDTESGPSRIGKRPRDDDARSEQLDERTPERGGTEGDQPEDLASRVKDLEQQNMMLIMVIGHIKKTLNQHLGRHQSGYSAGPHNNGRSSVPGSLAYGGFGQGHNGYHGINPATAPVYAPFQSEHIVAHPGHGTHYPGQAASYPMQMTAPLGQMAPHSVHMRPNLGYGTPQLAPTALQSAPVESQAELSRNHRQSSAGMDRDIEEWIHNVPCEKYMRTRRQ